MSTYKDKQKLADKVYDHDLKTSETIKVHNNPNNLTEETVWSRVDGLFTRDPEDAYFGAVYTNGKGEYILVSRGTDNFANKVHDGEMHVFNQVPPEFIDAYQLAAQATAYVQAHGGTLSFDGHSLGGTISQLLAIVFGGEATTFNPYNSQNFLHSIERIDQQKISDLVALRNTIQERIDNGSLTSQVELEQVNQQIIQIEANNKLYDAWNGGSLYDITNYRIENDQVSGATDSPLLGETITIKYDAKGGSEYQSTELMHDAITAFMNDIGSFHGRSKTSELDSLNPLGFVAINKIVQI